MKPESLPELPPGKPAPTLTRGIGRPVRHPQQPHQAPRRRLLDPADATQGCTPTVQVTIDTLGGGTFDTMVVYNVQTSLLNGMTEIGVSAQNIRGEYDLAGDFYCNLTVIGKPAAKK